MKTLFNPINLLILLIIIIVFLTNCTSIENELDLLKPGSIEISSSSEGSSSSEALKECTIGFNPNIKFCYDGEVYDKCDGMEYNPTTHICKGDIYFPAVCGGTQYNPLVQDCCVSATFIKANQRCESNVIETKCGQKWYNSETHFCSGNDVYSKCGDKAYEPTEKFCLGATLKDLCGGEEYTMEEECQDDVVVNKCGQKWYNSKTHFCSGSEVYSKCGGTQEYEPAEEFCQGNTTLKGLCDGEEYTTEEECQDGVVVNKCGQKWYNSKTHFCHDDNELYSCGSKPLNPATQFCYDASNSRVGNFCGTRKDTYNLDLYECRESINPNGIYFKADINYEGQKYKAVLIGEQTWMAENLNYQTETGSECYDENPANCGKYGRLYTWAAAKGLPESYNDEVCTECFVYEQPICPNGWHLPSNNDWNILKKYVQEDNNAEFQLKTDEPYIGKYLRAKGTRPDFENFEEDKYGFAALSAGMGAFGTSIYFIVPNAYLGVSEASGWRSATENNRGTEAYFMLMQNQEELVLLTDVYPKTFLMSVRCVMN